MSKRRAVVIDDEPDITTFLETLLTDNGWDVKASNSPNEGLELIESTRPDVVVLDVMMPERGGLSTLMAIRKHPDLGETPVVMLSGIQEQLTLDFRSFLDRIKAHKVSAFLDKPVDKDKLLKTLDEVTA